MNHVIQARQLLQLRQLDLKFSQLDKHQRDKLIHSINFRLMSEYNVTLIELEEMWKSIVKPAPITPV
jgi:hypothetical protein